MTRPLSTRQMRSAYAAWKCNRKDYTTITFLGRSPVKISSFHKDAWLAAETALTATGYAPAQIVGSYNCRVIAGRRSSSLHSYRLALDIDPHPNWKHLPWSRTKLKKAQADAVEAIRTNNGKQVFKAGWHFSDPMHFQVACTKADIETGINWKTVAGHASHPHTTTPVTLHEHHGMTLATASRSVLRLKRPYTKGTPVKVLQEHLTSHGFRLRADGVFGPTTARTVKRFQKSRHLRQDGVVGKLTWQALG